jgi:Raf kinase inhibitor-like YbhB/YbcL family protein
MYKKLVPLVVIFTLQAVSIVSVIGQGQQKEESPMSLYSSAFVHNDDIPSRYTCDGLNISPPLTWSDLPENTASLVLIVDDPDAPNPIAPEITWVHWILYNIPPFISGLKEAVQLSELPKGTAQGINSWKKVGYSGACPPIGRHRYFHRLYALDITLPEISSPNKTNLEKAMAGHVIDYKELVGFYERDSDQV